MFTFPEVPEKTKERVNSLVKRNRLPGSVLLSGGNERLRSKCALELASAAVCENKKDGLPCLKCTACLRIKAENHTDVIHIRPKKDRKTVTIDIIRERVLSSLYDSPNEAENKVYILHGADEFSPLIQNALLKTIEEPPPFVMFILLAEQREKLLTTVISRVSEFSLGDTLTGERKAKEEKLTRVAEDVISALCKKDEFGIMLSLSPAIKDREFMKSLAEKIIVIVRDACIKTAETEISALLKESFELPELYEIKQTMEKIISWAESNANENLLITQFSSKLSVIQKNRLR